MTSISRRHFLGAIGLGMAGARSTHGQDSPSWPNLVFILIDDMGRHNIGCYGNPFYETPNIDRLGAQGMVFTQAYAACPVCSPTRASIMTGKYPARLHLTDYIPGNPYPYAKLKTPEWQKMLPVGEKTLPELLKEAGYVSGHFGKWHLAPDYKHQPGRPGEPETQGFDEVLTETKPESEEAAQATADPDYDAHHARRITDHAIQFMQNHRDQPFFCYISHNLIHQPIMEYGPRVIKYANKREASNAIGNNPVIGAMVETLDKQVARVVETLDQLGLAGNTILVFFGDNGDYFGEEGLKPYRGAKGDLYEGGVRVPFLIRWPKSIRPGVECHTPVCSIDFFPTFAEITGTEASGVDGVSLVPLLEGQGPFDRDALYWHYPHYHALSAGPAGAIRQGRYKLIEWYEQSVAGPAAQRGYQLFNLDADPGEQHDLADAMPDKAKELYEKLKAWRKAVGAQEMTPNPHYDPEKAGQKS